MTDILLGLASLPIEVKALLMGLVEGVTEFLPVSSTGHLILAGWALGFDDERAKVFDIAIQTGAMLAIVWIYRVRFFQAVGITKGDAASRALLLNLCVAFVPAALLGLLFSKQIKAYLFSPVPVALAFIVGGLVMIWVERRPAQTFRVNHVDAMTWRDALKVGLAQAVALIPGTSRSGATIIGGMLFGLSRQTATEFSFFLAVPTLLAAGAYSLFKQWHLLQAEDLGMFLIGLATAFVSAMVVVRWFLRFVSSHSFVGFAYYRIVFGLVVLLTWQAGWLDWTP
ncbi:MAG: undecaprenyl-diphosphate phosphatase [Betaproteobacteria bacterium]|nr:undecaprenyl-diphosphate phosphatase [Betaproteobacteria bacterium]NBT75606.1 undecaprenyl-diphosphate phosphatase [Betaproteobacteria bacterium]NBY13721.1 undecaprenyl-diphosphate phosphatase [Betaproteobacteria bacterium]NCA15629.1 undecaprenyl-diphosphate phosphatase [Betaproteobacteria bacterium]